MEIVVGWLLFAALVGALASARGRSGFGFFLLSALLSPLIGLIVVLCISDLSKEQAETSRRIADSIEAEKRQAREHERQLGSIRAAASAPQTAAGLPIQSVADEISKLVELRDRGVLSADEFATQKARVLTSR